MVKDGDCVAIFHSIQRVMRAEKILLQARLDILMIPVPRQLSADCGMAIRFPGRLQDAVEDALCQAGTAIVELWLRNAGDYQRLY